MSFTPYSTIVQPAQYVEPIPTQLLYAGAQAQEQRAQQNLHQIQGQVQNIMNIPAINDADAQVLKQKQEELKQKLQGVTNEDLNNPQSQAKINEITSAFANDPDVLSVAHRGHSYQQMLADKKAADLKNENYYNPGLDDAQDYIQGNVYKRDTRFNNSGKIAPDLFKLHKEVEDMVPLVKEQYTTSDGRLITHEVKDQAKIAQLWKEHTLTDPRLRDLTDYNFNNTYKGKDFQQEADNLIQNKISLASDQLNTLDSHIYVLPDSDPKKAELIKQRSVISQELSNYQKLREEPDMLKYKAKRLLKDQYINDQANKFGILSGIDAITGIDMDKNYKMKQEFGHDFAKIAAEGDKEIRVNAAKEDGTQSPEELKSSIADLTTFANTPNAKMAWSPSFSPRPKQIVGAIDGKPARVSPTGIHNLGDGRVVVEYDIPGISEEDKKKLEEPVAISELYSPFGYKNKDVRQAASKIHEAIKGSKGKNDVEKLNNLKESSKPTLSVADYNKAHKSNYSKEDIEKHFGNDYKIAD